jgi:hypothetical protein
MSFHHHEDFCIVLDKLVRVCSGDRRESLGDYIPELCPTLNILKPKNITCKDISEGSAKDELNAQVGGVDKPVNRLDSFTFKKYLTMGI